MKQVLAAFIFFTRLPFWRLADIPSQYFKRVVPYWAMTGWLTAGCSVAILYVTAIILPTSVAIILAILTRLLITGCLHEDGLADFLDGFGGGNSRERILSIMKDSHIGTYGVIGLILYFTLLYQLLNTLPLTIAASAILIADPLAKAVASMIINRLPYARPEQDAKNKAIYTPMSAKEYIITILSALIPLVWLPGPYYIIALVLPVITFILLTTIMKEKIQGYTGDCCGATFLLCELSFIFGFTCIYHIIIHS